MQPRSVHRRSRFRFFIEDSTTDHQLIVQALETFEPGFSYSTGRNPEGFRAAIDVTAFDIILADHRLPGFNAEDAWRPLQALDRKIPFVLPSGAIGETAAVAAIHQGMSDYVRKTIYPAAG